MNKDFIKNAFRVIFRKRSHAWIHIIGLALGLSITLLIWMHVFYQRSYDRFYDDYQNIYRVQNTLNFPSGDPMVMPTSMFSFADLARVNYPEINQMTRLSTFFFRSPALRVDEKLIYTPVIGVADSTFFGVFSMKFLAGDPASALSQPGSMVLTHSLAQILFDTPLLAIHQSVLMNDRRYQVTAIVEDIPQNSHMAFNGLVSCSDLPDRAKLPGFGFYTYLKLSSNTDLQRLEEKLSKTADQALLENQYFEMKSVRIDAHLTALADIHLTSNLAREMKDNGNLRNVKIFSILSVFILLLAVINYTNMATARSSLRAKEIGLRKVAGAMRSVLVRQFMIESFVITLIAFIIALALAIILPAYFSGFLGVRMEPDLMLSPQGLMIVSGLLIFTGFVSGIYPAVYLSSFNPVRILKGDMVKGTKGKFLRRFLVMFQVTITIFLMSALLIMAKQLNFLNNQPLGYQSDSVLIARGLSQTIARAFSDVSARLKTLDGVEIVSGTNFVFGERTPVEVIHEYGATAESGTTADILTVDENFIPLMQLKVSQGRNFHSNSEMDAQGAYLLNKAAVKAMKHEDPIGMQMEISGRLGPVVGIVEDFHLKSLHHPVEPVVFRYAPGYFPQIYLKLNAGNLVKIREQIIAVLKDFDPAWVPDLIFLDEKLESQYYQELQSANLLRAGSLLAIIVSMLGVYGLAAFAVERRVREIGIRKVLGASDSNLLWIFNKEFFILVVIAFFLSAPLAWWAMDQWLSNFVLHIKLNIMWFFIPTFITLLLSTSIISLHIWKAAKENPVKTITAV